MSKVFWIILAVVITALIGLFVIFNRSDSAQNQATANPSEVTSQDYVRGKPEAKVTLIEYGDFQCPACGNAYPLLKQLEEEYPEQLKVVFRHFPLTSIHPNAFAAARAAEAAGAQGKFFEMHDLIYEKQSEWSSSPQAANFFKQYAEQLGLDVEKYEDDYGSGQTTDRINAAVKLGQDMELSATPTFYLNGEKLDPNPKNYDEFKAKIESALQSSN